jgi:predicted ATPase/DNA-binding SARP family transcriptional activator
MRFGILGTTLVDGRPAPVAGPRLRALLAMLLLDAGRVVPVERLIDGLYGEQPPAGAVNAVQSQVSRLRQALPVEHDGSGYRLAVDPDEVDAHRFTRLAADGHRALAAGDREAAAALLREALGLWRGEALADVRSAPFAAAPAGRLTELRRQAVEDRIEAELPAAPITELRDLVAADPLREHTWALLMRALVAAGRPAEALTAFDEARRLLADELGADPSAELTAVHAEVLRGPATRTRHGVPAQLTSFIGRDDDLRLVAKALTETRLVTLHGPGGAGKTRLAAETAGQHDGDVCFVELAAAGPADVPGTVLDALGLRDAGLRDRNAAARPAAADRLVTALAGRELLLVLDNCEHVIGAAAALTARLLARCPGVRVLATSREPLGLTGEVRRPVSGLGEQAAVRLFADRAADVAPGFTLTPENADAAGRICRTLDGLPLAVELAAARLPVLAPAELAERVGDRFGLLSRGSRTAAERHRTLRAVVAWSWDLLTEPERRLARRFTVFRGGAGLAAVEAVCGLGADTVDVLADLVAKSLIERDGGRFRMLATIHAFCAERLDEADERTELAGAHSAHFLGLARTADSHLRTADQLIWLAVLDADRDNLHSAIRSGDTETAMRLVSALSFYWWLRGLRYEAATLTGDLLRAAGPTPPPGLAEEYALTVLNAGLTGDSATGDYSVRYLAATSEPPAQPFLLYLSAIAAGPPAEESRQVLDLHRILRERLLADPWSRALARIGSGWLLLLFGGGTRDDARLEFTEALAEFRAIGERWGMMLALNGIAEQATWRGDHAAALAPMDEALRLAAELGSAVDTADLLRARAEGRLVTGDLTGAADDFAQVVAIARDCGAPELSAAANTGLGRIALTRGDLAEARRLGTAALDECPAGWYTADGNRMTALVLLGRIAEQSGDHAEARRRYRAVSRVGPGPEMEQALAEAQAGLARTGG